MTYLKHTLLLFLVTLFSGWGLVSCSHDEPVQEPVKTFKLCLQLTTDTKMTRAEGDNWGDEYNSIFGSPYENRISKVDIYLIGGDNRPTKVKVVKDSITPNSNYVYIVELHQDTPGLTYDEVKKELTFNGRIMAIANVADMDSPANTPENWESTKIPYEMNFVDPSDNWMIPMWGVENYTGVILKADEIAKLNEPILMLRSVSKIIVNLDRDIINDYKLGSIRMSADSPLLYGEGYTLPKEALNQTSTRNLDREDCFDPKTGEGFKKFDNPNFISRTNFEKYTYVSESKTVSNRPFKFEVTLESLHDDRPDITGTLYFSNYVDFVEGETITDVVRNHVYEFTIRLSDFKLLPIVREWIPGGKVHIDW